MKNQTQTTGWAGNLKASLLSSAPTRGFDGDGGAGGGGINADDPAVKALIEQAVEQATGGLKTNSQKLSLIHI